jgi:hypothetical protein
LIEKVFVKPNALAVSSILPVEVRESTVTVNCLLDDPAGIVRVDGAVIVAPVTDEPSERVNPAEGAAAVSDAVHCTEPAKTIVVVLQLSVDNATGRVTVTVPAAPVAVTVLPVSEAA